MIVSRLKKIAQSWGGDLIEVPRDVLDRIYNPTTNVGFSACPFNNSSGVFWKEKCVFHVDTTHWSVLLHEMGHVFAAKKPPEDLPNDDDGEYSFLGWEHALCRHVRAPIAEWKENNGDYELNNPVAGDKRMHGGTKIWCDKDAIVPFSCLSGKEKNMVIRDRVAHAKKIGLIVNNKPIAIR